MREALMFALLFTHPIDWLIHDGVGQNLTAGALVFVCGLAWSRTKYWPLRVIHARLDRLHASHEAIHASHRDLHEKLDRLLNAPTPDQRPGPSPTSAQAMSPEQRR